MEERFFLDRVALDAADIAPGYKQGSAPVVANLANSRLAVRDLATVPTSKTPHPVAVELFVQFAFANVFINNFVQRAHMCQMLCRPSATHLLILVGLKLTAVDVILVDLDIRGPLLGKIIQRKNCRHWADRYTGAAINALSGVDVQLRHFIERRSAIVIGAALRRMDTIHRAHVDAGGVLGSNARFSDDVCHQPTPAGGVPPLRVYAHSFFSGRGASLGTSCAQHFVQKVLVEYGHSSWQFPSTHSPTPVRGRS